MHFKARIPGWFRTTPRSDEVNSATKLNFEEVFSFGNSYLLSFFLSFFLFTSLFPSFLSFFLSFFLLLSISFSLSFYFLWKLGPGYCISEFIKIAQLILQCDLSMYLLCQDDDGTFVNIRNLIRKVFR